MFSRCRLPLIIGLVFLFGTVLMGQDTWSDPAPTDNKQKNPGAGIVPTVALLLLGDAPPPPEVVVFPDPNLEQAVRDAISKPSGDILASDLLALTELTAEERAIEDLTGLEYCSNLLQLILPINAISNLAPLSGLTSLTVLNLGMNQISDLGPLSGLINLVTLVLNNNQIIDLVPLSGLTNLVALTLSSNQISDIAPLVDNSGLGTGDVVTLQANPLSPESCSEHVPALLGRGVAVNHDC